METKAKKYDMAVLRGKYLLTSAEAAALGFFTSAKAAAIMRSRGLGPVFVQECLGGPVHYRPSDLSAWVAERLVDPRDT